MKGHKWFAALYDPLSKREEETWMQPIRTKLVGGARGRVLEIGAGTGHNLPYYRHPSDDTLVLTEPDPYMIERLRRKLRRSRVKAELVQASAEALPFPDATFDTVISSLVMCTVPDLPRALSEVKRVLKPAGQLRFYEHVRALAKLGAFVQDLAQPMWSTFGAGCHPNRDIAMAIEQAGFRLVEIERLYPYPPVQPILFLALVRPHIQGAAQPGT